MSRSCDCQNPADSSCARNACHSSRSQQHPAALLSRISPAPRGHQDRRPVRSRMCSSCGKITLGSHRAAWARRDRRITGSRPPELRCLRLRPHSRSALCTARRGHVRPDRARTRGRRSGKPDTLRRHSAHRRSPSTSAVALQRHTIPRASEPASASDFRA